MTEPRDLAGQEMERSKRSRQTYRRDRIRGACYGMVETCLQVFALLVIIREFQVSGTVKSLLVAAYPFGLLLTPVTLFWVSRRDWTASTVVSRHFLVAGVAFLVAAGTRNVWFFFFSTAAAAMLVAQQMPLMVHIYSENYTPSHRGRMLSSSIVLSVLMATVFSLVGGAVLDIDLANYHWLFFAAAVAAFVAGFAVKGIPSSPISSTGGRNPLANLRYAWRDPVFGAMLGVWMLMGLGNLIAFPLRIEYMANPAYGVNATNAQIALATAVIPSLVRIVCTHFWGMLFDRYDFFFIRMALNIAALIAIVLFFTSSSIWMLYLSGGIFGFALAGANIAWSLWVTKFAPADKAADYMSVHTFTTGLRGIAAPFIGFAAIVALSPAGTALVSATLIGTSVLLLVPVRLWAIRRRRGNDGQGPSGQTRAGHPAGSSPNS